MNRQRGMTLVELMVSLTVILIVMGSASVAYLKLLTGYRTQGKIAESYLDNVSALQLLRYDIEMAGYGLPQGMGTSTYANEAANDTSFTPNPTSFNEGANGVPRAFVFSNNGNTNSGGTDVLAIKSQVAAPTIATGRKWSMMFHNGSNWVVNQWDTQSTNVDLDFQAGERVILLDGNRILQNSSPTSWSFPFTPGYYTNASGLPNPASTSDVALVYGITPSSTPRMPFNRTDYYLRRPAANFPGKCFSGSYSLYRSSIDPATGLRSEMVLLDCVEDFQVAFGTDSDKEGTVETWSGNLTLTASQIRDTLREIRIFILHHEGQGDANFRFSGGLTLGDASTGNLSTFTPSAVPGAVNYRWKVLKMAIKPMNLG